MYCFFFKPEDVGGWKGCKAKLDYCAKCRDKNHDVLLDPPDDMTPIIPSDPSTGVVVYGVT